MPKETPLDEFGRFLMANLRDPGVDHLDGLLAGHWKAPSLRRLQRAIRRLPAANRSLVRRAVVASLDSAIHEFLFALQEQTDAKGTIAVTVRGKNIARISDGLQGELFTEDGWFARFSRHGAPPDEA